LPARQADRHPFAAAQAPEIFSRDQQHQILPLIFTRSVTRNSYATARLGALVASLFLVVLASTFLLYIGQIGIAADPVRRFGEMGHQIWSVLAISAITAALIGGVSGAIAVWTPRRAYATAGIIAIVLVLSATSLAIDNLAGMTMRQAELIDPVRLLRMLGMLLFGETDRGMETQPPLDIAVYIACALGAAALGALLVQLRVRRLQV
jgi:ABC-2 type transport system permease protein